MLDISKDEFLDSMSNRLLANTEPSKGEILDLLDEVWEQAGEQALSDHRERSLQHELGQAVMRSGGPEEVAKTLGVSKDTVMRWVVRPLDLNIRDLVRLQGAVGLEITFGVLPRTNKEN